MWVLGLWVKDGWFAVWQLGFEVSCIWAVFEVDPEASKPPFLVPVTMVCAQ